MPDGYTEFTSETLLTPSGITQLNGILRTIYENFGGDLNNIRIFYGYGSPESVITSGIGSIYLRADGGTGTSVYFKESGTGNTGWVDNTGAGGGGGGAITYPLTTANGGLGADGSAWPSGDYLYLSALGVIGHTPLVIPAQYVAPYNVDSDLYTIASLSTEVSDTSPSHKSSPMARSGVINASIDAEALNGAAVGTVYFRINGVQAGVTHVTSSYSTYTDNLTVAIGDIIDVVATGTNNYKTKNFLLQVSNPLPEVLVIP